VIAKWFKISQKIKHKMEAESTPSKEEQKQETSYQNPIQESIKEHGTTSVGFLCPLFFEY
jgi:hypothetical protein